VRRLLPDLADAVDPHVEYADPGRTRRDGRPWLVVNMISSVDGAVAVGGRSGQLGGPADRAVFQALRGLADVVLVGAGTVRAERYGPPRKAGQRIGVVTRGGNLDYSSLLFASGAGFVVTTEDGPVLPATVDAVRAGHTEIDLPVALAQLDADVVLCEGGPSLNGDLLAAGCVDEWCLTLSPKLVGGSSSRSSAAGDERPIGMRLAHLLEADGFLFTRFVRA
jgi:riboflavin biosynthesis pyrimidine reductase